jgi:protein SCO1/2
VAIPDDVALTGSLSEERFAALVDLLAADPNGQAQLTALLREDHALYDQRGRAATIRMRGWLLLAIARAGVSDAALVFLFEELDAGADAYLVAAAARALRSYVRPVPAFAPFVLRAITNIRYHDEPVSFEHYGEYAVSSAATSAVGELLATLTWLGPHAHGVLPDVEALWTPRGGLSRKHSVGLARAVEAIRDGGPVEAPATDACCRLPSGLIDSLSWTIGARRGRAPIESTVFEDHEGRSSTFNEIFVGHPSIVVFFYTRCDNPLRCSLTVTKLARIQTVLAAQGLAGQIHTAAITYDPAFDLPERLRGYGLNRGARLDAHHRILRATRGFDALRRHFALGVNFVESLVNRHRIEAYVLDAEGRIAASFERIHWDEREVVERAVGVLKEKHDKAPAVLTAPERSASAVSAASPLLGTLASLGVAFFPKCPICWATYLSVLSVAGVGRIPYSPWLEPVLFGMMLVNLACVWWRGRSNGRMSGSSLVAAGALTIVVSKIDPAWANLAVWGVASTLTGSLWSVLGAGTEGSIRLRRLVARA